MGYRRLLLTRWSRRDWLAILVVALTVAFLTGTTLLLVATGAQMTAIAAEFDSPGSATYYDDPGAARAAVGDGHSVLPVAEVTNGSQTTLLVGVPEELDVELGRDDRRFRVASGNTTTLGTIATPRTEQLEGSAESMTVTVQPRDGSASLLAPAWYVTETETVEQVGVSGAFVVQLGAETPGSPDAGRVPLLSALQFFLEGTNEVLRAFAAVAAGAAVLIGVTIFSVSRMSVRDRLSTIKIIRSTGARPRTVLGLFTLRAVLLTLVGTSLGYAVGVIVINATVNLAVALGFPTSLSLEAGPRGARVLGGLCLAVLGVGGIAGGLAAWPAVRRPPAHLSDDEAGARVERLPDRFVPSLLHWRALVPTAATLTTFVAFVVLVSAMASVAGPLTTAEGATITTPGATNPINSRVPTAYADAFHARGINASAEILLFEMTAGGPVLARGVVYEDFENVTDARLVRGRAPEGPSEAVIGVDLARTRGIEVGETLTLGGSVRAGLARVTVVGAFSAPGPFDDQLLVSLSLAQHLDWLASDQAHLVRAERLPELSTVGGPAGTGPGIAVVNLSVTEPIPQNTSFVAAVTLRNEGIETTRASVPVRFADEQRDVSVDLPASRQRTVQVEFTAPPPGTYTLEAGNVTRDVQVVDPGTLVLSGVPARVPPESNPLVTVTTATGSPVARANVTVGNRTVTTNENGHVRLPLSTAGEIEVTARARGENVTRVITVTPDATRALSTTLQIRPTEPSLTTRPEARLALTNPWAETVNATVRIDGPGVSHERTATVRPGQRTVVSVRLAQQPPGSYEVRASLRDQTVDTIEYRVTGDRRIVSALATTGGRGTTGLSQGIEVLFGNFQLFVGALLGLAALMTVGGTTATFAQAIHARRRTIGIYRATGAPPRRILRLVLGDAARIGIVASAIAFGLALLGLQALDAMGYLTLFGIGLQPTPSLAVAVGTIAGALCVTLVGATITTLPLLYAPPAELLSGATKTFQRGTGTEVRSDE